jgi:hypothetical protein
MDGKTSGGENVSNSKPGLHRATVNFSSRSWQAVEHAMELRGDSQTEVLNLAARVLDHIETQQHTRGKVLFWGDPDGSNLERLHIL